MLVLMNQGTFNHCQMMTVPMRFDLFLGLHGLFDEFMFCLLQILATFVFNRWVHNGLQ
jgi:hypothetical protein